MDLTSKLSCTWSKWRKGFQTSRATEGWENDRHPCMADLNESGWREITQHCHHKDHSQLKVSLGFTAPQQNHTTDSCRNERLCQEETPGKHPSHFGSKCLSLNNAFQYFCGCKNPKLSLFLAGTSVSWLVLPRNWLNGSHSQMYLSFIAHDCNCFPPGLCQGVWFRGFILDFQRNKSFYFHVVYLYQAGEKTI